MTTRNFAGGGRSHVLAIFALVFLFSFAPIQAQAADGFFENLWCDITGFFGFACETERAEAPTPLAPGDIRITTTLPPPQEEANAWETSTTSDGRVVYTTIVEEHNTNITNPTTIIRESSGGSGSSDGVSRDLFRRQIEVVFENFAESIDSLQEDLAEAFTTAVLTVSGNASVGGNLDIVGTLTAGTLNVLSLSSSGAIEAPYLSATSTTATSTFSGPFSLTDIVLLGSAAATDNFLVNAVDNAIESGTIVNTISGGGRSSFPNKIGFPVKPLGTDYTPTDWADDTGYVAGSAGVAVISGGYDHINNQLAGVISGGGHNFLKYNATGHSIISGGSYNLISGGRSVIAGGQRNTITGASSIGSGISAGINNNIIGSYSAIGGGLDNTITGDYSFIPGGRLNVVSGDWAFAFGRRAQATATGTVVFADSTNADFAAQTQNVFASRFSAGYWLTGGNVGIGTTSPNGKLSVYSAAAGAYTPNSAADDVVIENNGSGGISIVTPDSSTSQIFFGSPSRQIGAQIQWRHSTGLFTLGPGNSGAQVQILSGNSVEAVRINSSGNVGIGTTTPVVPLGFALTTGDKINLYANNYGFGVHANELRTFFGGSASQTFGTQTSGGTFTELVRIASTGNVGIGTTSPNSKLQVITSGNGFTTSAQTVASFQRSSGATSDAIVSIIAGNTANSYLSFGDTDAESMGRIRYNHTTNTFGFGANGNTDQLLIDSSGKVGIGTTTPTAMLDVRSGTISNPTSLNSATMGIFARPSGSIVQILSSNTGVSRLYFGDTDAENVGAINYDHTTNLLEIRGNSNSRMVIDSTGNIGIGTTTPSARLSITQSAQTTAGGFWLAASDNTDYRSMFMNTSGVLSFNGGDTAGTLNTATLNAAGEWTNASDIAYKENVENISYGLDALMELQPRSYDIKNTNNHRIGFIAQEVEDVIPEVVGGMEGSKGISYGNLVAVVVRAIQELSATISGFADIFRTNRVETNTLCVGQTCITENELLEILDEAHQQPAPSASVVDEPSDEIEPPVEETPDETTEEPEIVEEQPEEEPTPEPEPEQEPVPAPVAE